MRNESGEKKAMTQPRDWPTQAKEHIDRAAELLVSIERDVDELIGSVPELAQTMIKVQKALRHLEKAGAQTRPE
jgi:hypothetical protein